MNTYFTSIPRELLYEVCVWMPLENVKTLFNLLDCYLNYETLFRFQFPDLYQRIKNIEIVEDYTNLIIDLQRYNYLILMGKVSFPNVKDIPTHIILCKYIKIGLVKSSTLEILYNVLIYEEFPYVFKRKHQLGQHEMKNLSLYYTIKNMYKGILNHLIYGQPSKEDVIEIFHKPYYNVNINMVLIYYLYFIVNKNISEELKEKMIYNLSRFLFTKQQYDSKNILYATYLHYLYRLAFDLRRKLKLGKND